jgi:AcrR family transcriptional regulator
VKNSELKLAIDAEAKPEARGGESRREDLLNTAAAMFAEKGFAGTSIRSITASVGMLPGSIYYHFKSKEELLLAVYHEGVTRFEAALDAALAERGNDPWQVLESACAAHLSVLLNGGDYARIVSAEFTRAFPPAMLAKLNEERDRYELHFEKLIAALPLRPETNQWLFKVVLFGSLNWSQNWYREGSLTPKDLAQAFIAILRGNAVQASTSAASS